MNETVTDDDQHATAVPGTGAGWTGSGTLVPVLTGSAALVLMGLGVGSLLKRRGPVRGSVLATD